MSSYADTVRLLGQELERLLHESRSPADISADERIRESVIVSTFGPVVDRSDLVSERFEQPAERGSPVSAPNAAASRATQALNTPFLLMLPAPRQPLLLPVPANASLFTDSAEVDRPIEPIHLPDLSQVIVLPDLSGGDGLFTILGNDKESIPGPEEDEIPEEIRSSLSAGIRPPDSSTQGTVDTAQPVATHPSSFHEQPLPIDVGKENTEDPACIRPEPLIEDAVALFEDAFIELETIINSADAPRSEQRKNSVASETITKLFVITPDHDLLLSSDTEALKKDSKFLRTCYRAAAVLLIASAGLIASDISTFLSPLVPMSPKYASTVVHEPPRKMGLSGDIAKQAESKSKRITTTRRPVKSSLKTELTIHLKHRLDSFVSQDSASQSKVLSETQMKPSVADLDKRIIEREKLRAQLSVEKRFSLPNLEGAFIQ